MPSRADYRRAQQKGLGAVDMARLQYETDILYATAKEEAAIQDACIACNILAEVFWPKTAKKNIEKFLKEYWSLRSSVITGIVTTEDLAAYHKQYCNQEIKGKLFKINGTGKLEKVQDIRNRRDTVISLLTQAATALETTDTSNELVCKIKDYIEFLS